LTGAEESPGARLPGTEGANLTWRKSDETLR
jgi:hypothetical protein